MITGVTNTCQILTNTPFVLSGLSQTNLSTINITDVNGLDVSECFGITSKIITVNGDNVTLTGDCNTSLEINITEGVTAEVECLYTAATPNNEGILIFNFVDGTISDNIHPECCTALEGVPEIGPKNYYICRTVPVVCVECCENYSPTNTVDNNGYEIFDFTPTGGTVTTVPSAQCCYDYGFVESVVGGKVKCIKFVPPNPCEGLTVVEPVPQYGDITFEDPSTGVQTTLVPTAECCTSLGYSYAISGTKFTCFNSIAEPPTVIITNDPCCLGTTTISTYQTWAINLNPACPVGSGVIVTYLNCAGMVEQETVLNPGNISIPFALAITIQAKEVLSIFGGNVVSGNPYITDTSVSVNWGGMYKVGSPQNC